MSAYTKAEFSRIRKAALKLPGAKDVSHIRPRAYCIAKPASGCAVFVTPEVDAAPRLQTHQNATGDLVRDNLGNVKVGDWCILAYVSNTCGGGTAVIENLTQRKGIRG
jgi:hypothetical protein